MKDLILTGVDCFTSIVRLTDFPSDEYGENRVHITNIEATRKGGGAKALDTMCKNADELDITLSLNACALRNELYHMPWPIDTLIGWYERRGFRRVSSMGPSYAFMGRPMVRVPIKAVLARS